METISVNQLQNAFADELSLLKKQALNNLSRADYKHLKKIIFINRLLMLIGFATIWHNINLLSMICIGIALHAQWTIVAHHVLHGGYNKIPGISKRYHSDVFAMKWRRWLDWFDWIYPPAWQYEHNILHHFYTNETIDPDMIFYRINDLFPPQFSRRVRMFLFILIIAFWKAIYYSKNTLKAWHERKNYSHAESYSHYSRESYLRNYVPYIGFHFLLLPALFMPLSFFTAVAAWKIFIFVFVNRAGAEVISNIYSFCTIIPNHLGHDIKLQETHFTTRSEFYVKQIASVCNYNTGGFWRDYAHGFLNYQIEHHLFPDLPPSQYAFLQPRVRALCAKYKIPYKQESIFLRIRKAMLVLLGEDKMKS